MLFPKEKNEFHKMRLKNNVRFLSLVRSKENKQHENKNRQMIFKLLNLIVNITKSNKAWIFWYLFGRTRDDRIAFNRGHNFFHYIL